MNWNFHMATLSSTYSISRQSRYLELKPVFLGFAELFSLAFTIAYLDSNSVIS